VNTDEGVQLRYKSSTSSSVHSVLFRGHRISGSDVCGEMFEACTITVISWDNITLVAIPMETYFGLVTFNNDSSQTTLTFREQHVISVSSLDLECNLTAIFQDPSAPPDLPTLLSVCLHDGEERLVDVVFVELNLTNLTSSHPPDELFLTCRVTNPSRYIFFRSQTFGGNGVIVFVDKGIVQLMVVTSGGQCQEDSIRVCTDVERFVPVSNIYQAIYCSTQVYLIDVSGEESFPEHFSPSVDGVIMFCSSEIYAGYKDNKITLRSVADKTALRASMRFHYGEEVLMGYCVLVANEFFTIVQLQNGTVLAVNLNSTEVVEVGASSTPPQVFYHSVLVRTPTEAVVFSLMDMRVRDSIEGMFILPGAVINGPDIPIQCMTTTSATSVTTPATMTTSATSVTTPSTVTTQTTMKPSFLNSPKNVTIVGALAGGILLVVAICVAGM
jgi:hypothetical protein